MNKSNFISALESSFQDECNAIINCDVPIFETSEKFNKRMEKLIRQQKKPYFKMICTTGRRAACIIVAILVLSLSSLSVDAVRETVYDFFMRIFSNHTEITLNSEIEAEYPKTIENEYEISNLPDGFEVTEYSKHTLDVTTWYFKDDEYVLFEQYTKGSYQENYDNEHSEIYFFTDESGQEYLIQDTGHNYTFIWDNGFYIFTLTSNLDKTAGLNLCKSTKIK